MTTKKQTKKKSTQAATPADSATVLREYNVWRRDNTGWTRYPDHTTQQIGEAIDDAIKALEALSEWRALAEEFHAIANHKFCLLREDELWRRVYAANLKFDEMSQ